MAGALPGVHHLSGCRRQRKARQAQTQTQVNVFAVHEIGLVKSLQSLPHRLRQHQTGGIYPVHTRFPLAQHPPSKQRRGRGQSARAVLPAPNVVYLNRIRTAHAWLRSGLNHRFQGITPIPPDIRVEHTHKRLASPG